MISLPVNEEPSELSAIKSAEDAIKTLSSDDFIVKNIDNEKLQHLLDDIDDVIFFDKKPPESFSPELINECTVWKKLFANKSPSTLHQSKSGGRLHRKEKEMSKESEKKIDNMSLSGRKIKLVPHGNLSKGPSALVQDLKPPTKTLSSTKRSSSRDDEPRPVISRNVSLEPLHQIPLIKNKQIVKKSAKVNEKPLILPPLKVPHGKSLDKSYSAKRPISVKAVKAFPKPPTFLSVDAILYKKHMRKDERDLLPPLIWQTKKPFWSRQKAKSRCLFPAFVV